MTERREDGEKLALLEGQFHAEIKRLDQVLSTLEKSTTARFVQVNEFRGALGDLGEKMATRRELESFKEQYQEAHELLRNQVIGLDQRLTLSAGRSQGMSGTAKAAAAVLSSILVMIGIYTAIAATKAESHPPTTTVHEIEQTTTVYLKR